MGLLLLVFPFGQQLWPCYPSVCLVSQGLLGAWLLGYVRPMLNKGTHQPITPKGKRKGRCFLNLKGLLEASSPTRHGPGIEHSSTALAFEGAARTFFPTDPPFFPTSRFCSALPQVPSSHLPPSPAPLPPRGWGWGFRPGFPPVPRASVTSLYLISRPRNLWSQVRLQCPKS